MQVPAPFEYERATSVEHALALLERHGQGARLLAGGHSLLPMMKLRLANPEFLIDIDPLAGELGCVRVIADPLVRNRGTIGGALCQADPSEDLSAVCAAVGAQMVIRGAEGERVVGMDEFIRGPYRTAGGPAEILVEIRVPLEPDSGSAYEKVDRRVGDWAVAAAGASVKLDGGAIERAGVALAAVGAEDRSSAAQKALIGQRPSDELLVKAARLASEACRHRAVFLRIHPTGKMVLSLTESDGLQAQYAELVAGELGVPALDVKVVPSDTNRFGDGHGFNTAPSAGTPAAITSATGKIKAKAQLLAGMALGAPADSLSWDNGAFVSGDDSRTIADLALYAHGTGELPPGVEGGLDAQTVYRD